jgi:hypothetical protein
MGRPASAGFFFDEPASVFMHKTKEGGPLVALSVTA